MPSGIARKRVVQVRVTDTEAASIQVKASAAGLSVSEYIRQSLGLRA